MLAPMFAQHDQFWLWRLKSCFSQKIDGILRPGPCRQAIGQQHDLMPTLQFQAAIKLNLYIQS